MTTKTPKLISYAELNELFGEKRSRGAIRRALKAGEFPKPRQISPTLIAWVESELIAHYTKLPVAEYKAA
jgi:predicted DNA-binding transcriptional regulator AlpA